MNGVGSDRENGEESGGRTLDAAHDRRIDADGRNSDKRHSSRRFVEHQGILAVRCDRYISRALADIDEPDDFAGIDVDHADVRATLAANK